MAVHVQSLSALVDQTGTRVYVGYLHGSSGIVVTSHIFKSGKRPLFRDGLMASAHAYAHWVRF